MTAPSSPSVLEDLPPSSGRVEVMDTMFVPPGRASWEATADGDLIIRVYGDGQAVCFDRAQATRLLGLLTAFLEPMATS